MNKQDKSEKLKKKLRASEAARVKTVRERDNRILELIKQIDLLELKDKRQKEEIKGLEKEADELRDKIPHVGARIALDKMEKQLADLNLWTRENCTCGGDGPDTGCLACRAYHAAGLGGGL